MSTTVTQAVQAASRQTSIWFSDLVASLESNFVGPKCVPTLDMARQLLTKLNDSGQNADGLFSQIHDMSSAYFVSKMLVVYLEELKSFNAKLNQLSFDFSYSKVLVWAEVIDEDEATIDQLILTKAKANADSYDKGVCISTTLIEESDHIPIPPHYVPFRFFKN